MGQVGVSFGALVNVFNDVVSFGARASGTNDGIFLDAGASESNGSLPFDGLPFNPEFFRML